MIKFGPTLATSKNTPMNWNGWNVCGTTPIKSQTWSLPIGIHGFAMLCWIQYLTQMQVEINIILLLAAIVALTIYAVRTQKTVTKKKKKNKRK
jgi:hypothetical protein